MGDNSETDSTARAGGLTYADAGVSIEAGNALVARIAPAAGAPPPPGPLWGGGGVGGGWGRGGARVWDP
ncbi:MAG: hypothetical protein JJU40_01685, partial [Rhodobacteraceae bacterium]|nr:hypothetical protein [Paracoccaceae bacterium]